MSCDGSRKKYWKDVVDESSQWRRIFGSNERAIKALEYIYKSSVRASEKRRQDDVKAFGDAYQTPRTTTAKDEDIASAMLWNADMAAKGYPSKHGPPAGLATSDFSRYARRELTIRQAAQIEGGARVWETIQAARTGDVEELRSAKSTAARALDRSDARTEQGDRPDGDRVLRNPHAHDGAWFHSSPHRFKVGDIIQGRIGDIAGANQSNPKPAVYLTNSSVPHHTIEGHIQRGHENGDTWHVYEVEPLDKVAYGADYGEANAPTARVTRYVGNAFGILDQARKRANRRGMQNDGSTVDAAQVKRSNTKKWG